MEKNKKIKQTWRDLFNNYNKINNSDIYDIVNELYKKNNNIYPKLEDVFKCFEYFEINETKIVILGQDPYHGQDQATGLCFGVNKNIKKIPPSLKNIVKQLKNDLNIDLEDISLESWAKQGILMLNASLTVLQGKPGSHIKLWDKFTKFIIEKLTLNDKPVIFVAWGGFAYDKLQFTNTDKHKLLVSSHPSPLSVYKKFKEYPAFQDSKPFSSINKLLLDQNRGEIFW